MWGTVRREGVASWCIARGRGEILRSIGRGAQGPRRAAVSSALASISRSCHLGRPPSPPPHVNRPSPSSERQAILTLTVMFSLVIVLVVLARLPGNQRPAPTFPENAVEARRVIADAERNARAHPDDGQAQFAYGLSLMWLGRKKEARPWLARAEEQLPHWAWPPNALGWVLLDQHDYAGALPHFQRAVSLDSSYVEAFDNLAWTLARLDRLEESEAAYAKAVNLEPGDAALAAQYATTLFRDRKTSQAIAQIYRAIRLDSTTARYHATAGYFLRSRARFADARAEFRRAVELDPKPASIWVQLGITDYLMGDAQGADAAFSAAVNRDSSVMQIDELRTMWEAAKKGRSVPVQVESMIDFHLDSVPARH